MPSSLPTEYFTRLYAERDDPWGISTGWYEDRKRAILLATLPRERYPVIFEPGCSNGEATVLLATRCDRLIAWDVAEAAVTRARARTAAMPGVDVRIARLPDEWPEEKADLIVLAEVGYYLDTQDLARAVDAAVSRLAVDGAVVCVHWRHPAPDYPLTGDQVHAQVARHQLLLRAGGYADMDFLLDIFTLGAAPSAAEHGGVV